MSFLGWFVFVFTCPCLSVGCMKLNIERYGSGTCKGVCTKWGAQNKNSGGDGGGDAAVDWDAS